MGGGTERVEPHEYRLDPMWIRISWMLMIGSLVIFSVGLFQPVDDWTDGIAMAAVALLAILALLNLVIVYRWRLRVDGEGIHRRRLHAWRSWSWADFQEGRMRRTVGRGAYAGVSKRWWQTGLAFDFLSDADGEQLSGLCLSRWTPPPQPEPPPTLTLRIPKIGFSRTVVTMTPSGLEVMTKGAVRAYNWADVQKVEVARVEARHPSFCDLTLTLPDRALRFRVEPQSGREQRQWTGPKPEILSLYLERHVPSDRIKTGILAGPVRSKEDVNVRLKGLLEQHRQFRLTRAMMLGVGLVCLIWLGVDLVKAHGTRPHGSVWDYLAAGGQPLALLFMFLCCYTPIVIYVSSVFRKKRAELERERASLEASEPEPSAHALPTAPPVHRHDD